jgi:hypothetical protein
MKVENSAAQISFSSLGVGRVWETLMVPATVIYRGGAGAIPIEPQGRLSCRTDVGRAVR